MNLTRNDRERLAYIDGDANTLALIDQIELERDLRSCRAVSTNELSRPWKLAMLAAGLGLLIAGSFYYDAPDWDIPISIVMALVAYLTAPWSLRVMVERRRRSWPLMILATWFGVDGCYWLYWSWKVPGRIGADARGERAGFVVAVLDLRPALVLAWVARRGNEPSARFGTAARSAPSIGISLLEQQSGTSIWPTRATLET